MVVVNRCYGVCDPPENEYSTGVIIQLSSWCLEFHFCMQFQYFGSVWAWIAAVQVENFGTTSLRLDNVPAGTGTRTPHLFTLLNDVNLKEVQMKMRLALPLLLSKSLYFHPEMSVF